MCARCIGGGVMRKLWISRRQLRQGARRVEQRRLNTAAQRLALQQSTSKESWDRCYATSALIQQVVAA
jgi:hypothetical protein